MTSSVANAIDDAAIHTAAMAAYWEPLLLRDEPISSFASFELGDVCWIRGLGVRSRNTANPPDTPNDKNMSLAQSPSVHG